MSFRFGHFSSELAAKSETSEEQLKKLFQENYLDSKNLSLHERFQLGLINQNEYLLWLQSNLNNPLNLEEIKQYRLEVLGKEISETCSLISALSNSHNIACFSNTHEIHWRKFVADYPIYQKFKVAMASHLAGIAKPFPEAFQYMCSTLQTQASKCIFIDDIQANVNAASECGMRGILFKDGKSLRAELIKIGVIINNLA